MENGNVTNYSYIKGCFNNTSGFAMTRNQGDCDKTIGVGTWKSNLENSISGIIGACINRCRDSREGCFGKVMVTGIEGLRKLLFRQGAILQILVLEQRRLSCKNVDLKEYSYVGIGPIYLRVLV